MLCEFEGRMKGYDLMMISRLRDLTFCVLIFVSPDLALAQDQIVVPLGQTLIGRIVATQGGGVSSPIAAIVDEVNAIPGDRVAEGAKLAVLNIDDRKADLRSARARILVAEAGREVAQAALDAERATYDRLAKLKGSAAFNAARFEDSYKQALTLRAQIAVESAQITQTKAQAARILVDIKRSQILAPYDGIIMAREVDRGDFVTVGRRMFSLVNTSSLEVEIDVPTDEVGLLQSGMRLAGKSRSGEEVPVEVRVVLPVENALTRTRTVRLRVIDTNAALAVGQALEVTMPPPDGDG